MTLARTFDAVNACAREFLSSLTLAGVNVVLDWVCQRGEADFAVWSEVFGGRLFWVNVWAPLEVLETREKARGDRQEGLARFQFPLVHEGFVPDVTVDTHALGPEPASASIAAAFRTASAVSIPS